VLYDHFGSKSELHATVVREQMHALLAHQRRAVEHVPAGKRRLRAAYAAFFGWVEEHPDAWRLLFRDPTGPPAVAAAHADAQRAAVAAIVGYLTSGRGGSTQTVAIGEFLRGATNAVAAWWWDSRDVDRDAVVKLLTNLTWSGVAPLGRGGAIVD